MTKRLIACEDICEKHGRRSSCFDDCQLHARAGQRLGVLGSNGSGKTTLLRILADELEPDAGEVRRAEGLRVAYFDQNRDQLDPEMPLRRALAPEGDTVMFRDRPQHVAGWAARFLFRAGTTGSADRTAFRRRARPRSHRAPDAAAGGYSAAGRAHQRSGHPDAGSARKQSGRFPRRDCSGDARPISAGPLSSMLLAMDGEGGVEFFAELAQWEQANAVKKPRAEDGCRCDAPRRRACEEEAHLHGSA